MRATVIAAVGPLIVALMHQAMLADEPFTITIPGQGWSVAFEAPPLSQFQGQSHGKTFIFQGTEPKAFNVSMFVEEAKSKDSTNESCFKYYWPLAKRNPLIDQQSVKKETLPKFIKVTYLVRAHESTAFDVNYYFAFQGCWVDLHASWFPAATDADQKLAAFEKSIAYEMGKDKAQAK